jgi:hypothetical protein
MRISAEVATTFKKGNRPGRVADGRLRGAAGLTSKPGGAGRVGSDKRNAPHFAGRLGVQGGEICDVSMGGRSAAQAPAGTLNRVDAVSATKATPTPTKKTAWAHSPVAIPIASPEIPATAAST